MTVVRSSLKSFLQHAKSSLANAIAKGEKVTFVIGNESADLDSLTSSLVLAYIRSASPPTQSFTRLYYPIVNIPTQDIRLRPEFLALFRHADVDPDTLITLDDLPSNGSSSQNLKPENTSWILVDHNALQGALDTAFSRRVSGVIDHHDDEHKVPDDTGEEPRIITKSGSCTSLVANYCREAWDKLSSQAKSLDKDSSQEIANDANGDASLASLWDAQVAKLAIASILIDTNNLQDKVTEHDTLAIQHLEAKIDASPQASKDYHRDQFFEEISDAKADIGKLRLNDILRKDYKQWTEGGQVLGISSVVKELDFLMDKAVEEDVGSSKSEAFLHAVNSFSEARSLGVFAIMTTSTSAEGDFQRELFVSATNARTVRAAAKFDSNAATELGLAKWRGSVGGIDCTKDDCWRRIWQQQNVMHSRKQVGPLLRDAMKD